MKRIGQVLHRLLITAGIVLPIFMLVFEYRTHQLSGAVFDPMPTPWHALLLAIIPIVNLLLLGAAHLGSAGIAIARLLSGFVLVPLILYISAVGPAYFDAMLFLLIAPIAVFQGFIHEWPRLVGVPLALWAPVIGLVCLGTLSSTLGRPRHSKALLTHPIFLGGLILGAVVIFSLEIPLAVTQQRIMNALSAGAVVGDEYLRPLAEPRPRRIIERLCYPPQQFSSAGALYACGPVDVFGPLAHILNGYKSPGPDANSPIRSQPKMLRLFESLPAQGGSVKPVPTSWRGLSPGELP